MTKDEIQEQYRKLILPESKAPYHFLEEKRTLNITAYNPMCGDKFELHLDEKDAAIFQVSFHGIGCAISKASTSLLLREIEGKPIEEVKEFCSRFVATVDGAEAYEFEGGLGVLAALRHFQGRVPCIQLSWKALLEHLDRSK